MRFTSAKLIEFSHGSLRPIRKIEVPNAYLTGCSVNPQNGDIALTQFSHYSDPGTLLVVNNATGKPAYYQSRELNFYYFVGYDPSGDAFVDGYDFAGDVKLVTLRAGSSKLTDETPQDVQLRLAGGVAYDGSYVTIGDQKQGLIYEISGKHVVPSTRFSGICLMRQYAIEQDVLIAPNACRTKGDVRFYNYSSGGAPTQTLHTHSATYGVAVSPQ